MGPMHCQAWLIGQIYGVPYGAGLKSIHASTAPTVTSCQTSLYWNCQCSHLGKAAVAFILADRTASSGACESQPARRELLG